MESGTATGHTPQAHNTTAPPPSPRRVRIAAAFVRAGQFCLESSSALYLLLLGVSLPDIGVLVMVTVVAAAVAQPVWGAVITRFGAKTVGVGASALAAAFLVLYASSTEWWVMVLAKSLATVGLTGFLTALRSYIAAWAGPHHSETEFGRVVAAQTWGAVLGPTVLSVLMRNDASPAIWFCAAVTAAGVAFYVTAPRVVLDPPPSQATGVQTYEKGGLSEVPSAPQPPATISMWHLSWRLLPLLVALGATGITWGMYMVVFPLYMKSINASDAVSTVSYAIYSAPMILVAPRVGRILGTFPRHLVAACAALCIGAFALVYAFIHSIPVALIIAVVEGALTALVYPVIQTRVPVLIEAAHVPRAYGVLGAVEQSTLLAGTALATGLLTLQLSPAAVFGVAGCVTTALGLGVFVVVWRLRSDGLPLPSRQYVR